ncbi:diaminopimelate epimerase [Lichenihabitans sp. Uapishka_5]|uniref:diaminopimelate epimerase n=1 Tax=Lichenihabitans sp. Uapishka_5 TaxID=3037302 RepID=UPI0029E7DBB3|nr:diaminopimelate epimerase [Lichenihabitans sp. Uapishka_5]MDX7950003.1 diaminopimelate epimerase [Lichenihabitans sp. Uapishka_5]
MAPPGLPYFKMNGIGNAILVVDGRTSGFVVTSSTARAAAAQPGLGFDQLMAIGRPRDGHRDAFVTIFNADGTESGACGNGTRCVAWALLRDSVETAVTVETAAGRLACRRLGPLRFSVDMGSPTLAWNAIPLARAVSDLQHVPLRPVAGLPADLSHCAAVGMGNPHAVVFVPDVAAIPLAEVGPAIEHDPMFPARTNVSFAQVIDRSTIRLRVWERSAGATLACGSAACATAVAAVRAGRTDREVRVMLPGGDLAIEWRAEDGHVVMTGDVVLEHAGLLPAEVVEATG